MLSLHRLSRSEARGLQGLLFDLDDTLLDEGKLSEAAYSSLFRLQASGLRLVALTGRPASWAELVALMWPVEAAVAENGALTFVRQGARVALFDTVSAEERRRRGAALADLVEDARGAVPALVPADDVKGRISDFTFDIGEHQRASEETVQRATAFALARGARTTRSSVHLHFTFDRIDKASGALVYLGSTGLDVTEARTRFAFIGDSTNDASCFAAFRTTLGVANWRGEFSLTPRFSTERSRGAGFAEAANHICLLREA